MSFFQIIRTVPGDQNFHLFEELITLLYPAEIQKLKQLEGINHTLLLHSLVILNENVPVARCCIYLNRELTFDSHKTICIGNFECVNEQQVANTLFEQVLEEAQALDAKYLLGPMNGSTWDTYRLGVNNEKPLFFLEPYYHGYYHKLFSEAGFKKMARYVSNIDSDKDLHDERIKEVEARFVEQGVTFRNIDLANYEMELDRLHGFCMNAFKNNFLFTSIDKDIFKEKYLKAKPYIDPEFVIIAEDRNHEIVGFIFCLENFYDKKNKGMIIKTLAKSNSIRYGGMGNVLTTKFKRKALAHGYNYIIHAFMIESNASKSLSQHFSGETIREYLLYGKKIAGNP